MSVMEAGEGALESAAGMVDETKETVAGEFTTLRGRLDTLGAQWQGQARVAFNNAMTRWDQEATDTNNILIELAAALRGTQAQFTQQDETDSANFNAILG